MTSIIKVDTIQDQDGNNIINENANTITIGASGDTITIPSGATIDASGATVTLPTTIEVDAVEPQSGTSLTLGASGDTITIPAGATITNSGTATGFGKVLQVVSAVVGQTDLANTSAYVGSGASITPSSISNKILVIVDGYVEQTTGATGNYAVTALHRATTFLTNLNNATQYLYTVGARMPFSTNYLDSPSSTSSTQYRIYHSEQSGGATYRYYQYVITLMEIEA